MQPFCSLRAGSPYIEKCLFLPGTEALTLSRHTSATFYSPEPILPHSQVPSSSPSLLLPQPRAAARQGEPQRQEQPAKVRGRWVPGHSSRLWLCSVPFPNSLVPGHAAGGHHGAGFPPWVFFTAGFFPPRAAARPAHTAAGGSPKWGAARVPGLLRTDLCGHSY